MIDPSIRDYLSRIGRKGGKASTPVKAKAVRRNGRKGGRPKRKNEKRFLT